jgi:hypothetical protein
MNLLPEDAMERIGRRTSTPIALGEVLRKFGRQAAKKKMLTNHE